MVARLCRISLTRKLCRTTARKGASGGSRASSITTVRSYRREDVVYTFNRAADSTNKFCCKTPGFVFSALGFKSARTDGPLDVTIVLTKYSPIALGLLAEVYLHLQVLQ